MKNLKLFASFTFIALAFSSIQETQGMESEDKESAEKTQCATQSKENVSEEPIREEINIDGKLINITEEYEKRNCFTDYHIEIKKFDTFQEDCGEDERVLVFGTGHWYEDNNALNPNNWRYPQNAYLANNLSGGYWENEKPDLLMSVEINEVPKEYVGKFNIVIFEGVIPSKPDIAFQNASKLLINGEIFLVYVPFYSQIEHMEILYNPLINSGFSFSKVMKGSFEYEPERQYIGKWIELSGDAFYWVWKKERNI